MSHSYWHRGLLEDTRADLQHFQTFVEDEFSQNDQIDRAPSGALQEALWALRKAVGAKVAFLCKTCDIPPSEGLTRNFQLQLPPEE